MTIKQKFRQVSERHDPDCFFGALLLKHGPPSGDKRTFVDLEPALPYAVRPRSLSRTDDAKAYERLIVGVLKPEFTAPQRIFIEYIRWLGKNGALDLSKKGLKREIRMGKAAREY